MNESKKGTGFGIIGMVTAACLFMPDAVEVYMTGQTDHVSVRASVLAVVNGFAWTGYGIRRSDPMVYFPNFLGMMCGLYIVCSCLL